MRPDRMWNTGLKAATALLAVALSGCSSWAPPNAVSSQEWLIVDGCIVMVKGKTGDRFDQMERLITVDDDCKVEVDALRLNEVKNYEEVPD